MHKPNAHDNIDWPTAWNKWATSIWRVLSVWSSSIVIFFGTISDVRIARRIFTYLEMWTHLFSFLLFFLGHRFTFSTNDHQWMNDFFSSSLTSRRFTREWKQWPLQRAVTAETLFILQVNSRTWRRDPPALNTLFSVFILWIWLRPSQITHWPFNDPTFLF